MENLKNKEVVKRRLNNIEQASACLSIEGMKPKSDSLEFMKDQVKQGKTPDEIHVEIKKRFNLE